MVASRVERGDWHLRRDIAAARGELNSLRAVLGVADLASVGATVRDLVALAKTLRTTVEQQGQALTTLAATVQQQQQEIAALQAQLPNGGTTP